MAVRVVPLKDRVDNRGMWVVKRNGRRVSGPHGTKATAKREARDEAHADERVVVHGTGGQVQGSLPGTRKRSAPHRRTPFMMDDSHEKRSTHRDGMIPDDLADEESVDDSFDALESAVDADDDVGLGPAMDADGDGVLDMDDDPFGVEDGAEDVGL